MKWIKLKTDCSMGKKGSITQVNDATAETWIRSGMAVESDAPKKGSPERVERPAVQNKAMSA